MAADGGGIVQRCGFGMGVGMGVAAAVIAASASAAVTAGVAATWRRWALAGGALLGCAAAAVGWGARDACVSGPGRESEPGRATAAVLNPPHSTAVKADPFGGTMSLTW